ncbi:ATP synthase I chain [Acididesulfobacillus acetoxydans]|uniref:ATP synthase I chain n=1 Tax=Acididesulfobacillus acetoxydans TaxID=1561005 RepID=A0A8S0VVK9_9FIRM|nr:ATP synthase subunit I [Acididesulfobacillus acetoxydans]CAA7599733.1 ATP synthase I chain [Acididesulfobacillus acetoxydans]CEJ06285.1 ATP synthase I chain [Acididesulfobacillus acetoxydans]
MKSNSVALWVGVSGLFFAIALSDRWDLLGAVVGYLLGFLNSAWLYRDTQRIVEMDLRGALTRMRRSLFARLALVTAVVVGVARLEKSWLPDLALGIAAGLLISLVSYMRRQIMNGKE